MKYHPEIKRNFVFVLCYEQYVEILPKIFFSFKERFAVAY